MRLPFEGMTKSESRNRVIHELKTDSDAFEAAWAGEKPYEVRQDDRAYSAGDFLLLREHVMGDDPADVSARELGYTGRWLFCFVTSLYRLNRIQSDVPYVGLTCRIIARSDQDPTRGGFEL